FGLGPSPSCFLQHRHCTQQCSGQRPRGWGSRAWRPNVGETEIVAPSCVSGLAGAPGVGNASSDLPWARPKAANSVKHGVLCPTAQGNFTGSAAPVGVFGRVV